MQDKDMVNDVLNQVKSSLSNYAMAIGETENMQLRQQLQQIRNNCESFQYDLFNVAKQKGYYKSAATAPQSEINAIRQQFSSM